MGRILLVGHGLTETLDFKKALQDHFRNHQVDFAKPQRNDIRKNLHDDTELTVLNYASPLSAKRVYLQALRDIGYGEIILILSQVEDRNEIGKLQKQSNVVLLEKPFTNQDLIGLSDRILNKKTIGQRIHKRFGYDQTVGIEGFGISGKIAAQIKTISKGGALLQLKGYASLRIGELIRVHIQLPDLRRYHMIPAQVVSSEGNDTISASDHFGVTWLPQLTTPRLP